MRRDDELGGNPIGWCSEDKHGSTDLTPVSDVYDLEEASLSSRPRCDRVFMLVPTDGTIKGCKSTSGRNGRGRCDLRRETRACCGGMLGSGRVWRARETPPLKRRALSRINTSQ